jgi:hypothetical protein
MSIKTKLFVAMAAAALVGVSTGGSAYAACSGGGTDCYSNGSTTGFTINAGVGPRFDTAVAGDDTHPLLDYPTVGVFNDVTMNGSPQLTSAVIAPFTVIDDSGTGAGWSVTLTVPNFSDGGTPANIVPAAGVQMNAPVVSAGNADSAMGGVWGNPAIDFTAGPKIVEADPADVAHGGGAPVGPDGVAKVAGMGTYLISPQILKLVVPANAVAGAYTSAAVIAITNTP